MQRSVDTTVSQRSEPRVQRLGVGDALNWIADKANYLPGFRLLTIVLGMNPINLAPVDRSAANILRALARTDSGSRRANRPGARQLWHLRQGGCLGRGADSIARHGRERVKGRARQVP